MSNPSTQSRIEGAIMGAFIGDALALGPHWYYDLAELRQEYGDWISDYSAPKSNRYHAGLKAGASSQAGIILALTIQSLLDNQDYNQAHFCQQLDTKLFPYLDGTPMHGPGGFTSQSMRDVWQARQQNKAWGEVASNADNTEAAERIPALAALYFNAPKKLSENINANVALTQSDPTIGAMTCAYGLVLGQLIQGQHLDANISGKLMSLLQTEDLAFPFPSPDALLTVSSIASAVQEHNVRIEPAWKVSLVYGLPCAVYHQLPAVYHLAARFQTDFESAVLHAVNGGGQNQARALLTGALCGAIGGIEAIPERFIKGLLLSEEYKNLATQLAQLAINRKD